MSTESDISNQGEGPPEHEYTRRVLYSLMGPAARIAAEVQMDLKEITQWAETAYFHDLKERGLKMREMSDLLNVSVRKVAMLSKQLKLNFLRPEREVSLPRQIEFVLWAEPLSRARLAQTFTTVDEDDLDDALEVLLEEGRVVAVEGRPTRYDIASPTRRIVGRGWMSRIDGLNNLMNNVADAVIARFFDDEERAFARTLQLRIRPEDLPELNQMYEQHVWDFLKELDQRARGDEHAIPMAISILWAPEVPGNTRKRDDE